MQDAGLPNGTIWLRVMTKLLYLVAIVGLSASKLLHHLVTNLSFFLVAFIRCAHSMVPASPKRKITSIARRWG